MSPGIYHWIRYAQKGMIESLVSLGISHWVRYAQKDIIISVYFQSPL